METKPVVSVPAPTPKCTTCFNTGIPYVGTIDYSNPLEIALWGGIVGAAFFSSGIWKVLIPAGLLVLRYQASKLEL